MINSIILFFCWLLVKCALFLRYRIKVVGLDKIKPAYGEKGILFMPNHPALIDPVIVSSLIFMKFHPRMMVVDRQIKGSPLKYIWKRLRILPLPDLGVAGISGRDEAVHQLDCCVDCLKKGDNLLFYPGGRIYHSARETMRANGGAAKIIHSIPDLKVVLVRTTGLWGSDFSRAKGYQLSFGAVIKRHLWQVLLGAIFFMPRRSVTVEFYTRPEDMPDGSDKMTLNHYLDRFYSKAERPNLHVPYTWFEFSGQKVLPEAENCENKGEDASVVPAEVRKKIHEKLTELTGRTQFNDQDVLATDLGMDSLVLAELHQWLQDEFEQELPNPEKLRTVACLMRAAIGCEVEVVPLKTVPHNWFYNDEKILPINVSESVPKSFLLNAKQMPSRPVWADQMAGVFTNRRMVLMVMALLPSVRKIEGERIGILMPATVISTLLYLVCQFAGKVPVMINWTVGNRNMRHCVKTSGITHILSAKAVMERLKESGVDFSGIEELVIPMEKIAAGISIWQKLSAAFRSRFCWRELWKAEIPETAAILFTSGSESLPKAVPIRHESIMADLKYSCESMDIRQDDCLLGMLPPFHSFGLLLNTLFTCVSNIRCVYHANPMEGAMLARLTDAYRVTFFCGTPTFISNILKNGKAEQFSCLKLVVTGAEKCRQETLDLLKEKAPCARLFEGYGITECGPIVSLNKPDACRWGSIGKLLDCTEGVVTDEALTRKLPPDTTGMLLVRGVNVFPGYINYDGPSPFVEFEGKRYYRTGDLVQMDENGFITFMGRLKRFVKLGGEMISLPAMEEVLLEHYPNPDPDAKGPALAVEALGNEENPVITLFTTISLEREKVNECLRYAGFSPLQSIREVRQVKEIPVLGTGKTDYRRLIGEA